MGVKEGLSSKYTTCMHQDKYGFIWIGTQFGLNLYDGYQVKKVVSTVLVNNQACINLTFILQGGKKAPMVM